jgi:hypothetical protein
MQATEAPLHRANMPTISEGDIGFFYIYFIMIFAKIYGPPQIFAKIYICRRGPRRQGHNLMTHGGRSRQEWAYTLNAAGHGVTYVTPWATALGA